MPVDPQHEALLAQLTAARRELRNVRRWLAILTVGLILTLIYPQHVGRLAEYARWLLGKGFDSGLLALLVVIAITAVILGRRNRDSDSEVGRPSRTQREALDDTTP